ncbi:2-dehydropantoate 2-reductase [Actinokineospora baliensis]|uniref:ketopantoate reductase family protein n=1 Tax=Actinokineospora baliensis TaxID=547056 RepID=UPI00195A6FBF|nr:2-dehydropantoate 2-reductase N-terminal domain-containing protein [Actinokineospora baliensis]MBM7774442.1 2-dehydropantoate 2-reductase [Actinokineospora baliensis]
MRYVIIGAGAVGCAIGGTLHAAGHEVVLVARGAHGAVLRERGLTLITPRERRLLPVPAVGGPDEVDLRGDDVLVLTVKTQDAVAALEAWRDRPVAGGATAGARLPLLCAQNGVAGEPMALRRFRNVYGVCVLLPSTFLTPGEVTAAGTPYTGLLAIGRYPHGTDSTAEQVSIDLRDAGFLAPVMTDVMRWKYAKLRQNLANAIDAVCGERSDDLRLRAVTEASIALAAAGIDSASDAEFDDLRANRVTPSPDLGRGGSSTWQSIVRGTGSTEVDYLNGEIVRLGRLHGVPTPVNEVLLDAARESARLGRAPGEVTAEDLLALLE